MPGPEVHEDDASVPCQHDVVRFDVAMEETRVVHRTDRTRELESNADGVRRTEGATTLHSLLQRFSIDELHPQADAIVDAVGAVDGHDISMMDAGQQPPFFEDCGPASGQRAIFGEELQGDVTIELRVPGPIDLTERTEADAFPYAKVPPLSRRRLRAPGPRRIVDWHGSR